ncbi:hypothetical protein EW146_g4063 [Bondarzewia mesenterica]|uniref:Transmembrane protein n=1 Tax=Bondarzewia mesenterica TaxID=1095465 RepID=A0A4S4LVV4_9AGAM|nr:hypothetical protein EW146_g4063 [Bondarzewia mesenterica]
MFKLITIHSDNATGQSTHHAAAWVQWVNSVHSLMEFFDWNVHPLPELIMVQSLRARYKRLKSGLTTPFASPRLFSIGFHRLPTFAPGCSQPLAMTVAVEEAIKIHGYLELIATKIKQIWPRPVSKPSMLFLLNRYVPFFGNIAVTIVNFSDVAASEKIFALLLTVGLVVIAIASWALVGQSSNFVANVQGCHLTMSDATGIRVAVAWEGEFVLDMIIFSLTVARTYQHRDVWTWSRGMGLRNTGLVRLVLRDGALYFVTMALANLLNILTFYLAPPILKGVLSTFSSCISVTMMSRLMLNLHEAVVAPSTLVTTREVAFAIRREDDDSTFVPLHTLRPSLPNVEAKVNRYRSTSAERFESEASRQE